jgi:hypothetical protein
MITETLNQTDSPVSWLSWYLQWMSGNPLCLTNPCFLHLKNGDINPYSNEFGGYLMIFYGK